MLGLDIQDTRLRTVLDLVEKGNIKKALFEVNKVLKRSPGDLTARIFKALILLKSGKTRDAGAIAEELIDLCPTDEPTLSAILCYFRETGQANRATDYLKAALKKCPNREDLLVCLFLSYVQAEDFSAQQATARLLLQQFSTRMYTYWVIVSTLMQADDDPSLGDRMYLPLCEKLLLREINSNKMEKHMEFQLLIDILRRLGKHKEALDFLSLDHFTGYLDNRDYSCDYSTERLQLLASLDRWDDAFTLGKQKIFKNVNDWDVWKTLISMVTNCQREQEHRLLHLSGLISTVVEKHSTDRGPHLAKLDLIAVAMKRGWQVPHDFIAESSIRSYFRRFATKPICALDLAYLLPLLLPVNHDRLKLIEDLLQEIHEDPIRTPLDPNQTCRYLCTYQIARANGHTIPLRHLLATYLSFVPERKSLDSVTISKRLGDEEGNSTSIDLCPANGLLLLALSTLVEHPLKCTSIPRNIEAFGLSLLAAYWTQHLGIVHASTDHHFRLRMCVLFGPHALACPDLALSQLRRLDVKQLLFVSLGYLVVTPTPVLTLWSTSPACSQQQQEDNSPVLDLFRRLRVLSVSCVSEAEEGILSAYRRRAYTRVREFTQFAKRLRHADVFLASRLELLTWSIIVIPDDFDASLEHMGSSVKELDLVSKRLEKVSDCRDFSVSPTFDPPLPGMQTAKDTFSHEVRWLHMRLLTLRIVHSCAELVMSSVKCGDRLLNSEVKLEMDERAESASDRVEQCIKAFTSLQLESPKLPAIDALNSPELAQGLTLERKSLFIIPAQLSPVQLASLYLHGPFGAILLRGASLMTSAYRFLAGVSTYVPQDEDLKALSLLCTSSTVHSTMASGESSTASFWSQLPSPSEADFKSGFGYLMNPTACHPAGVLLLLGSFFEAFALSCLFVSMLRSMLRPRSHLLQSTKRQKRKASRQQRTDLPGDAAPSTEVFALISNPKASQLIKDLDSLGLHLLTLVDDLVQVATRIIVVAEAWAQWAETHAVSDCLRLASTVCTDVLPPDLLQQFPILVPNTSTTLFTEVAGSYEKSFGHLAASLHLKVTGLHRMRKELRVYDDCATKLAACDLREVDES